MAHGCQIVYFVGLCFLNNTGQIHRIGHVAVMKNQIAIVHMWILIKMIDTVGVEKR